MPQRYLITLGARTAAGGKVISASSSRSINGAKVAVEDDKVMCPKCRTVGSIKTCGPRLTELCNGREVALHDDVCLCKCSPPPRLIAKQTLACQNIDGKWHAAEAEKSRVQADAANAIDQPAGPASDEMPLLLLHPETREPLKHRPYQLQLKDKLIEGMTDENGATRPLSALERKSLQAWHVDDGAGAG